MVTPVTQHDACDDEQWYFNNFKCIVRNQRFSTCAVICEQPFTINQWKHGKLDQIFFKVYSYLLTCG